MPAHRLARLALIAAPFLACAALYLPTLSGAFLSDDYAVLAALSDWARDRHLMSALLAKFVSGLDSPSNYYRPLTFVSFAVNFAISGADPLVWRLTNLGLHLASGALVYVIVRRLAAEATGMRSPVAPAIAAGVFLLFPTSPEAVAWVSGRYDTLALTLMLATLALFLRSTRWSDAFGVAALVTAAGALASKESAVLLPALVAAMAFARGAVQPGATAPRVLLRGALDVAPWVGLGAAYFALRAAIFGDAFQVYAGTSPFRSLMTGAWTGAISSTGAWAEAIMPLPLAREIFLMTMVVLIGLGALACWRPPAARAAWIAVAFSALLSVALLLPHLSALAANGEQGRLFYTTSALLALLAGLGVAAAMSRPVVTWRLAAVVGAGVAMIAVEGPLLRDAVYPWQRAGAQASALVAALPATAGAIPPAGYGFVLVPDHIGSVPFGRNAQGGLVLPPTQAVALSSRLIVQTPADLPAWPANARRGLTDALRRYPLDRVWAAVAAGAASGDALPTDYFCWDDGGSRIVRVSLAQEAANGDWMGAWRRALAASPCGEFAQEVGKL